MEKHDEKIKSAEMLGVNAVKVYEIMKTLTAMKLQKKDSIPGMVIKDKLYIGGIGTAYNKEAL